MKNQIFYLLNCDNEVYIFIRKKPDMRVYQHIYHFFIMQLFYDDDGLHIQKEFPFNPREKYK